MIASELTSGSLNSAKMSEIVCIYKHQGWQVWEWPNGCGTSATTNFFLPFLLSPGWQFASITSHSHTNWN